MISVLNNDSFHTSTEKVEFEFFHIESDSTGNLWPIPEIGTEILVVIENGNYFHCYVDEEHESYEEGSRSYTAIFTIGEDDFIEISNIQKWAYIKGPQ